jgi:hypothetical protein
VLPSLPYFNDNDKCDAEFYKDRGYEVAGDNEAIQKKKVSALVQLLYKCHYIENFGIGHDD